MQIKEFAATCGLSAHTLRYDEKIDLLVKVGSSDGHPVARINVLEGPG